MADSVGPAQAAARKFVSKYHKTHEELMDMTLLELHIFLGEVEEAARTNEPQRVVENAEKELAIKQRKAQELKQQHPISPETYGLMLGYEQAIQFETRPLAAIKMASHSLTDGMTRALLRYRLEASGQGSTSSSHQGDMFERGFAKAMAENLSPEDAMAKQHALAGAVPLHGYSSKIKWSEPATLATEHVPKATDA